MHRARTMVALAAVCLLALPVVAQEGRGGGRRGQQGPRMTAEQSQAAWETQVKSVASRLGVTDVDAMTAAYVSARKSFADALAEMRPQRGQRGGQGGQGRGARGGEGGEGGQGRGGRGGRGGGFDRELMEQMQELRETERSKLQSALESYVEGKGLERAMTVLGTFDSRGYDAMTHALLGLKLGDEKTMKAMSPLNKYVAQRARLRDMDREQRRDASMDMRDDLMAGLESVLDDEQMSTFQESMQRGRRGGRGGAGGAGGERGDRAQRDRPRDRDREERLQKALADLELSDEKREEVDKIVADHRDKLQELIQSAFGSGMSREDLRSKRSELTKALTTKLEETLGKEQYTKLARAAGIDTAGG